ncbi:MAG: transporter related [Verrucomicrobiales bacterium]|nr:transporter related [Verrucomicrobiales bacterium]
MNDAIIVEGISKSFRRYSSDRPASLKEAMLRGLIGLGAKEKFWALRDVSFSIAPGKMVGVIGTNGAGKSTLLRLLGSVGKPDAGKITVQGRIGALLDLTSGFHPDLTGRENVFVSGVIFGLTRRAVTERFDEIVAFAGLEKFIDNPVRTYSTGMQMRLGFAVAIHTQPNILLIDEVLAVGDLAFQQKCLERIKQFKERGCTIMLISHDASQVTQFCDEAISLRAGKIVAHGKPEIVVGEYVAEMADETRRRTPLTQPVVVAPCGRELRVNENRFGSMEMKVSGVRLLDREGLPAKEICGGHPLTVGIEYETTGAISEPIFCVSVTRSHDGFVCYDTSTAAQGLAMPTLSGNGQITLTIERLDLADGEYYVDVGIFEREWAYAYDYHWHVYPLRIRALRGNKGIIAPPQRWRFAGGI